MKRNSSITLVALFVLAAFVVGLSVRFASVSAQDVRSGNTLEDDRRLATEIKRITDRSGDGLVERRMANGAVMMDLGETFQNVMLARLGHDGEPISACITSLSEANHFFGRDLETGETVQRFSRESSELEKAAARHGMSVTEFQYYSRLIADAAAQRAASPNAATLTIVNADGAGEGFNDATAATPEGGNTGVTRGEQRLILFNFAAGIWGSFLDSSVNTDINSQFNSLTPCSTSGGVLGSAGSQTIFRDFTNAGFAGTWYHAALANKATGTDNNAATQEINARFNTDVDNGCLGAGTRFYYGLNNSTPAGRVNLLVVLLHEMGHGLGFSSFVNGSTGALNGGFPDIYTRYMFDRTTNKYWYQMTNAERQASALNVGNVLWDGSNVKSASAFLGAGRDSSGRVQLYTPAVFASGSSISHFDTAASPNLLMEPSINLGLPLDLDLTKQQMRDIGWYRDTTSDVVPDTIVNVSPSGNTVLIGSTINITWTNTGGFNKNITIELSTDGGSTFPTALATNFANTGSFSFVVPNTPTTTARIRVREAGFTDPAGVSIANFSISNTAPVARRPFDFDGDSKTDIGIYRPNGGSGSEWWVQRSSNSSVFATQFGAPTDRVAAADYTGDGKTDVAFWRPSTGQWFILRSEDNSFYAFPFGANGDVPVPGDYDADGKADVGVFRPSSSTWFIQRSSDNGTTIQAFGTTGDVPVNADYDGDGKADIAIYRPSAGQWWLSRSSAGNIAYQFGSPTDKTVQGDYTGDGKADVAFWRPSTGEWFILRSEDSSFFGFPFGTNGDTPVPGDYDGDGRNDAGVFRSSSNTWFINRTTAGTLIQQFGTTGDLPLPNAYVR